MSSSMDTHIFWGKQSPLVSFTGSGLLIIASDRVSSAVICALALVWVNAFTMLAAGAGRAVFPKKGGDAALLFVASFTALLYYFTLTLISPITALESALFMVLCPIFPVNASLYGRVKDADTLAMVSQGVAEALVMGVLILALALIREPLGSGSVSIPGRGIISFEQDLIALLKTSSGALIVLGYGTALYRGLRGDQ